MTDVMGIMKELTKQPIDFKWENELFDSWISSGCDREIAEKVVFLQLFKYDSHTIPESIGLLTNLKKIIINANNNITSLPESIGNLMFLEELTVINNEGITHIPESYGNLERLVLLSLGNNNLSVIPEIIFRLRNLNYLDLSGNKLTTIPESICNLINLKALYIDDNRLTSLPIYLSRILPRIIYFMFNDNPIEYVPPQILRIINGRKIVQTQNIYNDTQSVHMSSIQQSFRESVERIMNQRGIDEEQLVSVISENDVLNDEVKSQLLEYIADNEPHSVLNVNFLEVCQCVFRRILGFPKEIQDEIFGVMNVEMSDALCKCFTGRLTRLVNCLNGFDSDVVIHISINEQLSNIILMIKERLVMNNEYTPERHLEEIEKEFRERGIDEEIIKEWTEL